MTRPSCRHPPPCPIVERTPRRLPDFLRRSHVADMMKDAYRHHGGIRGGRVHADLSDNWDFWPMLPLPLAEARARLGIAPPEDSAPS